MTTKDFIKNLLEKKEMDIPKLLVFFNFIKSSTAVNNEKFNTQEESNEKQVQEEVEEVEENEENERQTQNPKKKITWKKNGVQGSFKIENKTSNLTIVNLISEIQNKLNLSESAKSKFVDSLVKSIYEEESPNATSPQPTEQPSDQQNGQVDATQPQQPIQPSNPLQEKKMEALRAALKNLASIPSIKEADIFAISISKIGDEKDSTDSDINGQVGVWMVSAGGKVFFNNIINGKKQDMPEQELTGEAIGQIDSNLQSYAGSI